MQPRKSRLGFYCPGNGTGGPWRYLHSILAALDPHEFDATVFCDLPGVYEPRPWVNVVRLSSDMAPNLIPATSANSRNEMALVRKRRWMPRSPGVWKAFVQESRRLARILRPYPIELLHSQNAGCEESPLAARLAGLRKVIGTFHVDSTYDLHRERSGPTHRVLEQISNRCLDVGIAVSRDTARDWIARTQLPARKVVTIYNGIDPEKFRRRRSRAEARAMLGLPAEAIVVGGLGRLDEAKGFEYLIQATALLRNDFPSLTVAIAGAGPLRSKLEVQAASLGIADRVRFLGFQSDVQLVLDSLDVFAFPSVCETLGYALLEAMATELPAVGAITGGIPEVIADEKTGILVPSRKPERLAEALRRLLRDPDLRLKFGAAGRTRVVENFQEQTMVRKTIELYRRILGLGFRSKAG